MKMNWLLRRPMLPLFYGLVCWVFGTALPVSAAVTNVSVVNFAFTPSAVTINVNDQVLWTWNSGLTSHSTTSIGTAAGLWNSGLHPSPFSFTNTFPTAGSFPYWCSLHTTIQQGSVTVQAANVPPTVSLSAPTNGATFAAPWTGTIQAAASDPDGSVTKVEFFAGATSLGAVNNPGPTPSITVTNLAAGNYTLTAVATDNGGAMTTSSGVSVHVVQPAQILLSTPRHLSGTSFQFSYSATPGLSYIIHRSGQLPIFAPVATNTATLSTETFQDNNATGVLNFYQVRLAPNP
jgi:plastocyanin